MSCTVSPPEKRARSDVALESRRLQGRVSVYDDASASVVSDQPSEHEKTRLTDAWVAAELDCYDVRKQGGHRVARGKPHWRVLESGVKELERRFGAVTVEQDEANPILDNSCPYVLVALGVKQTWEPPSSLKNMRFVVLPVSPVVVGAAVDPTALFITCMPGNEHGAADGFIHDRLGGWLERNGLLPIIGSRPSSSHAPGSKQPDTRLDPRYPAPGPPLDNDNGSGRPYSRLIVEVEYAHRGVDELRRIGQHYLDDHYCRAFLAVKIWKKSPSGFGAVVALWLKNAAGNVALDQAFDFGTRSIGKVARDGWARPLAAATHLPPVPVAGGFVRPPHVPAAPTIWGGGGPAGPPAGWTLTVPADVVLFEVYDQATPPNRVHLAAGHDWVIDLHAYQKLLDDCM